MSEAMVEPNYKRLMQNAIAAGNKKFDAAIIRIRKSEVNDTMSPANFETLREQAEKAVGNLIKKLESASANVDMNKTKIADDLKSGGACLKEILINNFKSGAVEEIEKLQPGFFDRQIH